MKRDKTYLQDTLNAIEKILTYIQGADFLTFQNNYMMQDAIIRNLEIIGETSRRLSSEFEQNHPEYPYAETVGMRNALIHEYDKIDLQRTWDTVKTDLPRLKETIQVILTNIE